MPRKRSPAVTEAAAHYRTRAKEIAKYDMKPNLSKIARRFHVSKSSLWYALNPEPSYTTLKRMAGEPLILAASTEAQMRKCYKAKK